MNEEVKVLDHGYIKIIEKWGSDERIIESARMSTAKGFLGWGPVMNCNQCGFESNCSDGSRMSLCSCGSRDFKTIPGDEKLLRFLHENKHATPFEFAGMVIEVQAPIFVFREWHRHRTQSYNEMSARYTPLPDVNYIPSIDRLMINSAGGNKQAGAVGDMVLTEDHAKEFRTWLKRSYEGAQSLYEDALSWGVPKELARVHLPVGRYSRMRASANLRNWLGFLTLRMDSKAQWEIRQYANEVGKFIAKEFPRTWELFAGHTK